MPAQLLLQSAALWLAGTTAWPIAVIAALAVLLDTVAYNSMVAFVTQRPQVPLRSVVFALLTFAQLALTYAVFYRALPQGQFERPLSVVTAFYFSVVTMATIGYGDIAPKGAVAQLLVVSEIALGVFFLATILSTIASWANGSPELPTLEELRGRAR